MKTKNNYIAKVGLILGIILAIISSVLIIYSGYNLLNFSEESAWKEMEMYFGSPEAINETLNNPELNLSSTEKTDITFSWMGVAMTSYLANSHFNKTILIITLSTSILTFLISLLLILQALYNISNKIEVNKK